MSSWESVIGLEIHVQLATKSKMFSGASTAFGAKPNSQACAVDIALPGVLPVVNAQALAMAVKFGIAINADIARHTVFARKNYFYPDSPKGYQISQLDLPIVSNGILAIDLADGSNKKIRIDRAHLEEDAGKSLHEDFDGMSGIDLNRAGTPLLEIVSAPELTSAKEAVAYLKKINLLVRYLAISDGDMSQGSMRCDANVSVRKSGAPLGTRAEIKNVNSYRFVEKAINYEIARQIAILEDGGTITQETRLYDSEQNTTRSMRSKEEANDYRYFPDPDLAPVKLDEQYIQQITIPELPDHKQQRYISELGLSNYDASLLVADQELASYFEQCLRLKASAKSSANWILGELLGALNKANKKIADSPISAQQLSALIKRIEDKTISGKIAKQIFNDLWNGAPDVDQIIAQQGLKQVTDTKQISAIIEQVINDNPQQVQQYKAGRDKLFGFFVGQVMKASQGKANPQQVSAVLKTKLN